MMTVHQIEEQLRAYIVDAFLAPERAGELRTHADLLQLLDSLQLLRTVVHLEGTFGVKIEDSELSAEHLGTVERMTAFVARKLGVEAESYHAASHSQS
jgi:acyl carrier protein